MGIFKIYVKKNISKLNNIWEVIMLELKLEDIKHKYELSKIDLEYNVMKALLCCTFLCGNLVLLAFYLDFSQ